ncbi:FAD-dependent oxidoreductase [Amycolatopsis sp. AA4]|uniref:FAD-dependent monooxygenase n=1 Tax=Actinomycetes TaxID=1760 RepID=UPI0001B56A61|nr:MULTISPECIES: FAD-dependent monooxygenase [Actinomycetes]ATY10228.1 FAD-dependent oxidoreductase [Amycolatopsis sp. AA4]
MNVLISGAGVAGVTLAELLTRSGHRGTIVERAPALRHTGYAVDFRGAAFDALSELGILDDVRQHDTKMTGTAVVDRDGVQVDLLPAEAFAGELEVPKHVLNELLYGLTVDHVEYRFGTSIASLSQTEAAVTAELTDGSTETYDLVFGADGVYSKVRQLAFAPHSAVLQHLGLSGAGFTMPNFLGLDHSGLLRTSGHTAIYLFNSADADRLTVSLSFGTTSGVLDRLPRVEQESATRAAFAGDAWHTPRLLEAMSEASDFYFSSSTQVHLNRWSTGRIALVGDAGYCAAPTAGMGTSQALLGARSLARHLAASAYPEAFAGYEAELRPYVTENQANGRSAAALFGGRD